MASPPTQPNPADAALVGPGETPTTVTARISALPLAHPHPRFWWIGFPIAFVGVLILCASIGWLFIRGIGVWGVDIPVAWGFAIVNFVWWIGIGHAGTLISAILLVLHQHWRTSINRFTEAMTLFAVACAALFPLLHLGRPQYFYWLLPYPDTMGLWPQWRSPLIWDVFAVSTYGIVSLLFWYVGLLPDLATLRDRALSRAKQRLYGLLSLGWRGDARHWRHYQKLYVLLAGLATPLVVSVHSIVGLDFAIAILPGWHSTIFPPYFVAGAIYSGFAMVLTLVIPLRAVYGLKSYITARHLDLMAKVLMATGWMVVYGYFSEFFAAWRTHDLFERYMMVNRLAGPYAPWFWLLLICNLGAVQILWIPTLRRNVIVLFIISLIVNVGMWLERFIIVVTSLHRDFLPSSWGMYRPTFWDWSTLLGTFGLFVALLFLFIRYLPAISMAEMRGLVTGKEGKG
ncbi:polysulfide reductase NrfD [Horticoccus luteus]|uniref:Polysulfide reductase NrfD n=1 Tax=Horticoccus luteus TaxID=2862869 RepID=A0A8F9XG58_9BACT|nr:NrfD/PsrC family molybdoenzyme membrane anchor subunit [Horticoccus luteus]QYM78802.1 polysulfide reductase NrfD [Horticoccus luteus]